VRPFSQQSSEFCSGERRTATPTGRSIPLNDRCILWVGNMLSSISGHPAASEAVAARLRVAGWTVLMVSQKRNQVLRLLDMLAAVVRFREHYRAVVVDVYSGKALLYAELVSSLALRLRQSVVLVLHGGGLLDFAKKYPQRVQRLLASASVVVTPSLFLRHGFEPLRGDITHIPNGLDLGRFQYRVRTHPQPSLSWLRAFRCIYNPEMAVQTAARLARSFPQLRLRMAGPDQQDGSLQRARRVAAQLGIEKHIEWPGWLKETEAAQFLSESDVFLNTTNFESFGVSTMAAAATGNCIVTTDVGELPLLWTHERSALLVPKNDARAAAEAVTRLLTEAELAERLSIHARHTAERYNWPKVLPKWEGLLNELLDRKGPKKRAEDLEKAPCLIPS
jgi:glycosyltransferase involved in cell wall biosynthesis